jgi:regulator of RNase E activity RraA
MDSAELCKRFRALIMPVVCDTLYELGLPEQVLPSALRPLQPEQRMVGFAHTVLGRAIEPHIGWDDGIERIRSYLQVFEELAPDSVLVSVNPASHVGHFGELTANAAQSRGCVGCVLDGNLRDIEGLRDIDFQVFYRDLSPLNAIGRWEMAATQEPVTIGDIVVNPGDVIIGEFDGILVVPGEQADRVLLRAEEIDSSEARVRGEVAAGGAPLDSFQRHGHI